MRKILRRNKKAQIQGVDFALAMIIFMIMFAEVIVLSLTFMQPKYQNLEDSAFETRAEQISESFFESAGYPADWEYDYSTEFHSFGLRDIDSSNLNPNKISRITPNSLYGITYDDLIRNFSQERNFGFQLYIDALFDVTTTLTISSPTSSFDVETEIGDCDIWNFVISPNSSIIYKTRATTDASGDFSDTFDIGSGTQTIGYYTLVVFAKSPTGYYSIEVNQFINGISDDLGLKLLVQENENTNGMAMINARSSEALSTLTAITLYPFEIGGDAYGNESATIASPNQLETLNFRIPTNGTSVTILSGSSLIGSFDREWFAFPSILNAKFDTVFGAEELPENTESIRIEKLVVIRKSVFKAVLYLWSK